MTFIKRIYHRLIFSNYVNHDIDPDVAEWRSFLNSLPRPKDDVDMSYNKYLCKRHMYDSTKLKIMEVLSFIAMIPGRILANLPPMGQSSERPVKGRLVFEALNHLDYHDIAPQELFDRYEDIIIRESCHKKFGRLNRDAQTIYKECARRYGTDSFFMFLSYKDLVKHSALIRKYNHAALSSYAIERNTASPIITMLYEKEGRKFISFQHGNYLLQMIQAYMKFSEYFTWDSAYIDMFVNDLKCEPGQFTLYTPGKLKKKWALETIEPEYFCTYYFSNESSSTIGELANILRGFEAAGKKCKVRLHPRWEVNNAIIREKFKGFLIEEARNVTMEQSLASTEYVIALASTVLDEALAEGRKVVIDDVTNPGKYRSLKERKYVVLQKEHLLLSELMREMQPINQ